MGIFDKMVDSVSKKIMIDTAVNATVKTVSAVADYNNQKEYTGTKIIKVPNSSSRYLGMNYQDAQDELTAYGFTNIVLLPKKDLIRGWLTKDGAIAAISIRGKNEFKEKNKFPADAHIVITYHTFQDSKHDLRQRTIPKTEEQPMVCCSNCGAQIVANAKFCLECGLPITSASSKSSEYQKEYSGEIIKCPNCGEVLKPSEAICHACGYELRSSNPTDSMSEPTPHVEQTEELHMTYCSNCGTTVADGAKFCQKCGVTTNEVTTNHEGKRQQEYAGKKYKCPNCGESLKSFEANCPACGYEIRGAKGIGSVRELSLKLEAIEANRDNAQKRIGDRKVKPSERRSIEQEIKLKTYDQKATLIRTFPIPTTKEDLFEFLVLAFSNINIGLEPSPSEKAVSDAWEAKFDQAYEKARLSFGHTQDFEKIQALYQKKESKINQRKKKSVYLWIGILAFFLIPIVLLVLNPPSTDPVHEAENERLKIIAEEVYEALADENYVLARAKAASLTYLESHDSYTKKWDKTKKELLALIDATANGAEVDIPKSDGIYKGLPLVVNPKNEKNPKETKQNFPMNNEDIPADFIFGYKEAEFSKYNSPASENGLGGSKIYLVGTLEKIEIFEDNGDQIILGYIIDKENNVWAIMMHFVPSVTKTHFNAAVGRSVVCTVVYDGYSGKVEMPFTILNELLILENGTVFNGVQKLLDE